MHPPASFRRRRYADVYTTPACHATPNLRALSAAMAGRRRSDVRPAHRRMAAGVLWREGRMVAQPLRRMPNPPRVVGSGPSTGDQVGLAALEDAFGLKRFGDHPDCDGRHAGIDPHPLGEGDLITGTDPDGLVRR